MTVQHITIRKELKMERTGRQNSKMTYSTIDNDSGIEVIGFELRQGLMKLEDVKKDEAILKEFILKLIGNGKSK